MNRVYVPISMLGILAMLVAPFTVLSKPAAAASGDPYIYSYAYNTKRPEVEVSVGSGTSTNPSGSCQRVNVRIWEDTGKIDRTFTTTDNGVSGEVRRDPSYSGLRYTFVVNLAASYQKTAKATLAAGKFNVSVNASGCSGSTSSYGTKKRMDALWIVPPACMDSGTNRTGCAPLHRFYNKQTGAHFYTVDEQEKRNVLAMSQYRYEGITAFAQTGSASDRVTVWRFYHKTNGTHFYTASQSEANKVLNNMWRTYKYEGAKYSAYSSQRANTIAFHRFYKFRQGVHFYTTNASEAHKVRTTMSNEYRYEGVAYYLISSF